MTLLLLVELITQKHTFSSISSTTAVAAITSATTATAAAAAAAARCYQTPVVVQNMGGVEGSVVSISTANCRSLCAVFA